MFVTRNQIDRLGEALRSGRRDADVLTKLDELYSTYEPMARRYSDAVRKAIAAQSRRRLRDVRDVVMAERPMKSVDSIAGKLEREHTRLSTMQDIVGCRVRVYDRSGQE